LNYKLIYDIFFYKNKHFSITSTFQKKSVARNHINISINREDIFVKTQKHLLSQRLCYVKKTMTGYFTLLLHNKKNKRNNLRKNIVYKKLLSLHQNLENGF